MVKLGTYVVIYNYQIFNTFILVRLYDKGDQITKTKIRIIEYIFLGYIIAIETSAAAVKRRTHLECRCYLQKRLSMKNT